MLQELVAGTRLVDLVLGITVVEAGGLWLLHRATGRGVPVTEWGLNLLSGLCLMLALRGALSQAGWAWLALWLAAAGLAHGIDIGRRWRRAGPVVRPS